MARIPDTEVQRLKEEIAVQRLVESAGMVLKRVGKDLACRCPFHADDTASLIVTPAKNLWHCFGCGVGGGPIDWVMKLRGVSFRHAVELLKEDSSLAAGAMGHGVGAAQGGATPKRTTVRGLAPPVALDADDRALLVQVMDYYHQTLKSSPEAQAYLVQRGLDHPELIAHFRLGYANRTLGLRLSDKRRVEGAHIRARLERLGVYRESGHEHFNGSLVIPVLDEAGQVCELYGRKITPRLRPGIPLHLYLPGQAERGRGVFNIAAFKTSQEIILCEALIDALTFWCAGYRNVTTAYGIEGFTDELLQAFQQHGTRRVLIAFDRDEAGDRGAAKVADKLLACGIECWRIQFPKGMDANEYALKLTPAAKSLGLLIRKAAWLGKGQAPTAPDTAAPDTAAPNPSPSEPPPSAPPRLQPTRPIAVAAPAEQATPQPVVTAAPTPEAAPSPDMSAVRVPTATTTATATPTPTPTPTPDPQAEVSDNEVTLHLGEGAQARRWRVRGLAKNLAYEVLKVNLLVAAGEGVGGRPQAFHVDNLDLYAARARTAYLAQAAAELGVSADILKSDLGRVLLKLEALQDAGIQAALAPKVTTAPQLSEHAHAQALALLKSPDLPARILADFEACGVVGEATNKLVGYLAAVSRKLERPLAVVIQSSSAAGKSSLMDAILALVPDEEQVKYSAMTGQSLFYMGQTSLKHKILAIAEEEGAHRASYALKLLQSEGELTIASTGTDPATGNLITQEYHVEGPMSLFMTTTAIDIDEELMNRCLVLSVDEDREQTRAIHRLQRERRTLEGLQKKHAKQAIRTLHQNAQRLLCPLAVVNPYADQLTFLDDRTRTRRDHDKYLTLIDAIALLHQHQRPVKTAAVADTTVAYIEATLGDIALANRLAHEVLGTSLDELPPQTRRVLERVRAFVQARMQQAGLPQREVRFARSELRQATALSDTQLKVHLARLAELEYLLIHRAQRGQGYVYELLFDGDVQSGVHLSGLIDAGQLQADPLQRNCDARRSAHIEAWSASGDARPVPGRAEAAGVSAHGHPAQTHAQTLARVHETRLGDDMAGKEPSAVRATPMPRAQAPYLQALAA